MFITSRILSVLLILFAFITFASASIKKTSVIHTFSKTVLSSDEAIKNSSILYVTCNTESPRDLFSNITDCNLVREEIHQANISESSTCNLPIQVDDGVVGVEKIRVMWFGNDRAIVAWSELSNKLNLWQIIVNLSDCRITKTDKINAGSIRYTTGFLSEYVIKKNSFDVIYKNLDLKHTELYKVTYNENGKRIEGPAPWIETDVNKIVELSVINVGENGEKYLVLEKSLNSEVSSTIPFVVNAIGVGTNGEFFHHKNFLNVVTSTYK